MTEGISLTEAGFGELLAGFEHTAFRLELQPAYAEPAEADLFAMFLAGQRPDPGIIVPSLRQWYEQVAAQTRDGKRMERVRVQENPPTSYQRFERWLDHWNLQAGETIRYLTRARAHEIRLLPAAGNQDFWLLDSSRLIVMTFDTEHHRIQNTLVTDPVAVVRAGKWRDLAVHHSVRAQRQDAAA